MFKNKVGVSTVVFFTAFFLNILFCFFWIDETKLGIRSYFEEPSMWGWICVIALLFSCMGSFNKFGTVFLFLLLYIYSIFLVANLMYCRVFHAQISLNAYSMLPNLYYYLDSIIDVFESKDVILPLLVLIGNLIFVIFKDRKIYIQRWILISFLPIVIYVSFNINNSFQPTFERLRLTHHENVAIPILYSPFTALIAQYIGVSKSQIEYDEDEIKKIIVTNENILQNRNKTNKYSALVIIIVESLESFVLGLEVNGIPITPYLSALVNDSNALCATKVIPQVGLARSMDAQLIINCGLLPPTGEAFCYSYPSNVYPSLAQLVSERCGITNSYSITCDMPSTYNQVVISKSLGYANLITRNGFKTEPKSLVHVDDSVFFAQTQEMLSKEIWPNHTPMMLQLITYSMHTPFRLPFSAKKIVFEGVHTKLQRYLNVVNYSDKAIGEFITYLRNRDDYESMLIVITGDHSVFSKSKYEDFGITKLSEHTTPFTPLIILNSSETGIFDYPVPQTSIYPTIIELLGLTENVWPGIEGSIFHKDLIQEYDRQALSNYMIRHDYWRNNRK